MLYFAYGSNLNRRAMARRCPQARPVIAAHLHGYRLVFRRYADLAADTIGIIGGGLYEATPACLHALDRYEDAPKLYRRITVDVETVGGPREAMTYVIAGDAPTILPPDLNYYSEIARGYRDWGLDEALLRRARLATLNPPARVPRAGGGV